MEPEISIAERVMGITAKFVGEEITPEKIKSEMVTPFSQLGLNSVKFTQFLAALEKEFEFEFDLEKLLMKNHKNLEELVAYIQTKIGSKNSE